MSSVFYWFYKFTQSYKFLSTIFLFAVIGLLVLAAQRLKFEENITAVIPTNVDVEKTASAFEGFEMNKRLVFHSYTDDADLVDSLISTAHIFTDNLMNEAGHLVKKIQLEVKDDQFFQLHNYYYKNIPFYLDSSDYAQISQRITEKGIAESTKQLYKSLISPVGVVTTKMQLKDPFGMTGFPLSRAKNLQLDKKLSLYKNHIVSEDKLHLLFFIELKNPPNETGENGVLIETVDQILSSSKNHITTEYFGAAAVAVANANRIKKDIYITVTLALSGLFLFISFFYRSIRVFFLALLPGAFGGLIALAILFLVKGTVSIISLAVGSVLLGITIDYALHFFTHSKKEKDIQSLLKDLTTPLLMSSLTTSCAFYSLIFIRSTALQDLGIFAGTSVLGATLFTLIVFPHVISTKNNNLTPNWTEQLVDRLAKYPFHKKKWVLIVTVLISVVSVFTWRNINFERDMLKLNFMPKNLSEAEDHINSVSDYSANNIYLTIDGENIWEALESSEPLERLLQRLSKDSIILNHLSLSRIIPSRDQQRVKLAHWKSFWGDKDSKKVLNQLEESALTYGFKPNAFLELEDILTKEYNNISEVDLNSIISVFGENLIIKNNDGSVSILTLIKLSKDQKPLVLREIEKIPNVVILDRGYLTNTLISLLSEDFNKLVNISLAIVFLIILVCYGRIELALITFIPILLSWFWVLGLMGLFDLKFNIVNIIVCTFILGLGIDYSIFVMRGLTQQYKHGKNNITSYKRSIILSMISTLLGIGVLAFAQHPALQSIALLAIIGILSVIFITFSIEHLLFNIFIGNRKTKGVIPFTFSSLFLTVVAFSYFMIGCLVLQIARPFFMIPIGNSKKKKTRFHWLIMKFTGSLIMLMRNFKKKVIDIDNIDYSKPSVIISNHHSFIDILILLMFSPKVVMITNDWVYHSPFFGKPVQYADFVPASQGIENQLDKIQLLINDGYSIIVYPEGTRTGTFELRRFHKGAFYLADYFKLDIQPVVLHGTSLVMPKGDDFYLKNNDVHIRFLPRIKFDDVDFGTTYSERTKKISRHFKNEYNKLRIQVETPKFFREIIIKNYLYKNPILEWYVRIKLKLEDDYQLFHELVPKKGIVVDLGCGYGMMSHALAYCSSKREIHGFDYDHDKIGVAQNCPASPANANFCQGDVVDGNYPDADVFLICDVLHYLTSDEQKNVIVTMIRKLNPNGMIIIRDGDTTKTDRHKGTVLTEFFSTNFGFNKTRNKLNYISGDFIKSMSEEHKLDMTVIDNTKRTSNTIFVLKRTNDSI